MTTQRKIDLDLASRSYQVRIGDGLLNELGPTAAAIDKVRNTVVISDSNVAELYGEKAVSSLEAAGLTATLINFPAGEENKTLATMTRVFDELFAVIPAVDRNTLIVALGGGVAGDLAGFTAATALRGLRFLQCPTSLLADVDASVGGKTAVDHPAGKNLIGAFHQPCGVLIDVETLKTLPQRELLGGLAECVKHGAIRDESLLEFIETSANALLACRNKEMIELIARNVEIKAAVVSADERETGQRAHLNFGHTIGHAIETFAGYGEVTHGEGVSLGMVAVAQLALAEGLIDASAAQRLENLLSKLTLPTRRSGLDADKLWGIMQHDKKVRDGKVRFVLPTALGSADVFENITAAAVKKAIEYLA